jgi:hypothetical protein
MPYLKKPTPARVMMPLLNQVLAGGGSRARGMGQVRRRLRSAINRSRGMGQCYDELGDTIDCDTGAVLSAVTPQPVLTPITDTDTSSLPITYDTGTTSLNPVSSVAPSSSATTLSSLLSSITNAAAAGVKLYQVAEGPSLVPGTSAIYNPATGQYYNPTTGQVVNANGTATGSVIGSELTTYLPTILLYGGLALGAYMLIRMVEK